MWYKITLILIFFIHSLYGFSVILKPGWNYARAPSIFYEIHTTPIIENNMSSVNIALQFGFDIFSFSGIYFSGIYNPRPLGKRELRNQNNVYLGEYNINATNLYLNYEHRFMIPVQPISPYFTLGAAYKFGFWDYESNDKNTWNIVGSHGYKIYLNSHISLVPEALVYYQLTSPSKFYAVMINLGFSYDF